MLSLRRYRPCVRTLVAVVSVSALGASGALAGPLDPPPEPIAPTAKPLAEVEPRTVINATNTPGDVDSVFRITQPGSNYLVGNVNGVAGKTGIEIASGNVTVDLNGFAVVGVPGTLAGIASNGQGVIVRNGLVSNWGLAGIEMNGTSSSLVEGIIARSNGSIGIRTGSNSVCRFCTAALNTTFGIIMLNGGSIEQCYAFDNGGNGFGLGFASTIRGCVARDNNGDGIGATGQSTIVNCAAYDNDGTGINGANGSVVEACATFMNGADGIIAGDGCAIRGNVCTNNTGAGVHITSSDCRVEGNNCISNARGVDVDSAGNIIIRNTCSGNTTNWDIVVGSAVAPIASASTNGAAISGNTYAGS